MSERPANFNAGPATLPEEVLEEAAAAMLDYGGTGISIAELGHRTDAFETIIGEAGADLRSLLDLPPEYMVLFLPGGARGQFAAVPINLARKTDIADYAVTGSWSKQAAAQGRRYVHRVKHAVTPVSTDTDIYVPPASEWKLSDNAAYVHITPNETIDGVAFDDLPDTDAPIVSDESSRLLSQPLDITRLGIAYASAQKNVGPAGLAIVIVHEDLAQKPRKITPDVWNYNTQAKQDSMVNTPPVVSIYIAGLVLKWLIKQGGVEAIAEVNKSKATMLYNAIDESTLYVNSVRARNRSRMNVPFNFTRPELEAAFYEQAAHERLVNLEGHRSVGGARASLYNAMPMLGVTRLVEFMKAFEAAHS